MENGSRPKYSVTGHIMFSRQGTLFALPIDPQSWQATGPPEPVVEGVPTNFEMSNEGTIVHLRKSVLSNDVFLVDFEGNPTRLTTDTKRYWDVRLAPDQRRVAFAADEASGGPQRIWVWDLSRPDFEPQPIHFDGVGRYPAWYFDGTRVAFSQDAPDVDNTIQWVAPNDPNQVVEPLTTIQGRPDSFSPDGTVLAFWHGSVRTGGDTDRDIMLLPMQGDRTPIRYIATPAREGAARFSPDGRWLTYTSNITGQFEVYVTPYRGLSVPPEKFQVSQGGGENAVWAHDGKTIYYRHGDKMMEVAFDDEPEMRIGDPELLFEGEYRGGETRQMYDIGPEGEGFLMLTVPQEHWPNSINVILNWFEELKQRVPTGR